MTSSYETTPAAAMAACRCKLDSVGSDHSSSKPDFPERAAGQLRANRRFCSAGVFCDRAVFIDGGTAACFAAASVALRQAEKIAAGIGTT
jgi:hypothetical protein